MSINIFEKTLIIGLGLIGGSFAKALKKHNLSKEIFAIDFDAETIDLAKNYNVIVDGANNVSLLERDFDLIVIATPISSYEEIFDELSDKITPNTIIIDLGSIKSFIKDILPIELNKNFIACHPIAGSEKNGFENSQTDLFVDKKFIICPEKQTDATSLKKIEDLVKEIGCKPEIITCEKHDEIYALVSHLPQFISFLTAEFSPKNISDEFFKKAFRLDQSDPEIWSDIFSLNADILEEFYLEFFDNLEELIEKPGDLQKFAPEIKNGVEFDEEFLEANFPAIFFRLIAVISYLEISEIKTYKNYGGSGFKDFTSIAEILNYDAVKLSSLIVKNRNKILKIFNSIS